MPSADAPPPASPAPRAQRTTRAAAAGLAALALACVLGNLRVTAARTLVPLALATTLDAKERRTEKHPGLDDAISWTLGDGRRIEVDAPVDELAGRGARLEKAAGERTLRVDGRAVELPVCDDEVGMRRIVAPTLLAVASLLAVAWATRRRDRAAP